MPFLMLAVFVLLIVLIFWPTFVLWTLGAVCVAALAWMAWQVRGDKILWP